MKMSLLSREEWGEMWDGGLGPLVSALMFSLDSPPNVRHSMHFWEPKRTQRFWPLPAYIKEQQFRECFAN
jgi:hypothetical protein